MPKKPTTARFICYNCSTVPPPPGEIKPFYIFETEPANIRDGEAVARCPECGTPCKELSADRNRRKAQEDGTLGPQTPEGRERVIEAARRATYKHGKYAVRPIRPATPKRSFCKGCVYRLPEKPEASQCVEAGFCLRDMARHIQMSVAYAKGDPRMLRQVAGETHAAATDIFLRMMEEVLSGDVVLEQAYPSGDAAHPIFRKEAHPLIPLIIKGIRELGFDPASFRMTEQSAGAGRKDDSERDAAKADEQRSLLDILRDPEVSEEQKATIREKLKRLIEMSKDGSDE